MSRQQKKIAPNDWLNEGSLNEANASYCRITHQFFELTPLTRQPLILNGNMPRNRTLAISGIKNSELCSLFVGESQLDTRHGTKRVEDLRVGDELVSFEHGFLAISEIRYINI